MQHLQLPDITTQSEAWDVLQATSKQLRNRHQLDASELNDIHMITYSLEKAIAYFATQSEPTLAKQAQAMAIVVEDLHLHSENNRKEASQAALRLIAILNCTNRSYQRPKEQRIESAC